MVAFVTCSHTFHIQTAQDAFDLFKGPDPSYLVLKFGDNWAAIEIWPKMTLKG